MFIESNDNCVIINYNDFIVLFIFLWFVEFDDEFVEFFKDRYFMFIFYFDIG